MKNQLSNLRIKASKCKFPTLSKNTINFICENFNNKKKKLNNSFNKKDWNKLKRLNVREVWKRIKLAGIINNISLRLK